MLEPSYNGGLHGIYAAFANFNIDLSGMVAREAAAHDRLVEQLAIASSASQAAIEAQIDACALQMARTGAYGYDECRRAIVAMLNDPLAIQRAVSILAAATAAAPALSESLNRPNRHQRRAAAKLAQRSH